MDLGIPSMRTFLFELLDAESLVDVERGGHLSQATFSRDYLMNPIVVMYIKDKPRREYITGLE